MLNEHCSLQIALTFRIQARARERERARARAKENVNLAKGRHEHAHCILVGVCGELGVGGSQSVEVEPGMATQLQCNIQ